MKSKSHTLFSVACTLLTVAVSQAADYNYGALTAQPFTVTATEQARVIGSATTFNDNSLGSIFDRAGVCDKHYMRFDLSRFAGKVIFGNVSLNLVIDANWGGAINSGVLSTADSSWTYSQGGTAPSFTAIADTPTVSGNFSTGQTATWTLSNSTFTGFVNNLSSFHGLVLTASPGSQAHFAAAATLTGTAEDYPIKVLNAVDWSAATFDQPTLTLTVSGSNTVTGGNIELTSGTTLAVLDSASLGSGNFAGTILNDGTLAIGTSANQILAGAISGTGSLQKSGSGTLTLNGSINYKGATVVSGGILELPGGDWVTGNPWTPPGATGPITVSNGGTLSTSAGVTQIKNGLTLNGGTVSSRGITHNGAWGNLFLSSTITAGGSAPSEISSYIVLNNSQTISVDAASALTMSGPITSWNHAGAGITKTGSGTLVLSGANTYDGVLNINGGTVLASSSTALGVGGHNGSTMTFINDGATLALQGNISLDEHFHVWGSGVNGEGAIRNLSGNNALTNSPNGGAGYCLRSDTTVAVDAGSLSVAGFYEFGGTWGLVKTGPGVLRLTAPGNFTGTTLINAGTLQVGHPAALQGSAVDFDNSTGGTLDLDGQTSLSLGGLIGLTNLDATSVQGYSNLNSLTLNPQGSNSYTYSGAITSGASGMTLNKSGSGTQVLSGNNSITGQTSVNGGTLNFNAGTSNLGNIVHNGGALVFSGSCVVNAGNLHIQNFKPILSISGDADVTFTDGITHRASTLEPFDPYHASDYSFTGGVLRTTSIAGPSIAWDQPSASMHLNGTRIVALANNPSFITTTGWDDGNLINLGASAGGIIDTNGFSVGIPEALANDPGNQGLGGKLTKLGAGILTLGGVNTYTGNTVVEEGTLVLADNAQLSFVVGDNSSNRISGAGAVELRGDFAINTSAVTPASYTSQQLVSASASYEPSFTVIGYTQQPDGVTWTRRDGNHTWSFSEATGVLSLTQGSDYEQWATANGVTGAADADDDGDGMTNFQEYAFGLNPVNAGSVNPIAVPFNASEGTFSYTRRAGAADVSYSIEYSTDLTTWTTDTGAVQQAGTPSGEVETVAVTLSSSLLTNTRLFIRVVAQPAG